MVGEGGRRQGLGPDQDSVHGDRDRRLALAVFRDGQLPGRRGGLHGGGDAHIGVDEQIVAARYTGARHHARTVGRREPFTLDLTDAHRRVGRDGQAPGGD